MTGRQRGFTAFSGLFTCTLSGNRPVHNHEKRRLNQALDLHIKPEFMVADLSFTDSPPAPLGVFIPPTAAGPSKSEAAILNASGIITAPDKK